MTTETKDRHKIVDSNEPELEKEIKLLRHKFRVNYYTNLVATCIIAVCIGGYGGWLVYDSMHNTGSIAAECGIGIFLIFGSLAMFLGASSIAQEDAKNSLDRENNGR